MLNIKNTLKKLNLKEKDNIVIGCSTGPDSMCLLDLLIKENKYNIVVAHINHNVRKQSIKEEWHYVTQQLQNYYLQLV